MTLKPEQSFRSHRWSPIAVNLRDILVHTSDSSQSSFQAGTSPCLHACCRTCHYISSDTSVRGPQNSFVIKKAFSCQTSGLVYCISCRRWPAVYIGETGRTLRQPFGEHLWSIEKNLPGFPVAERFIKHGWSPNRRRFGSRNDALCR